MLCYVQLHALCSVTCYFTYVASCYVAYKYYVTYVILCYICNVMVHALYKMHYVTCFATNITLCCITGADSFILLHMLRFDTLCYIHYITYVTHVMSHTLLPFLMYSILRFIKIS